MNTLLRDAYAHWQDARAAGPQWIPAASAPVLYFGDRSAYDRSETRVLTVGVNPGPQTFPQGNPWQHYPALAHGPVLDPAAYSAVLDAAPLDHWFSAWDAVLAPLNAIHPRQGMAPKANRPLHVDLSPLMTHPSMSRVRANNSAFEAQLIQQGAALLTRLIGILQPHHTIVSVRTGHFEQLEQQSGARRLAGGSIEGHDVARYSWNLPGDLFWLRRTNIGAISGSTKLRKAVGAWAAEGVQPAWSTLPVAAPRARNDEFGAARDQRHSPEGLVEYLRTTLHTPAAWNQRGLRQAVKCWAPNGEPAHIGRQAKKRRVREFIDLWDADANCVRTRWGAQTAEARSHVTLGETAIHIPGLYLRWGNP